MSGTFGRFVIFLSFFLLSLQLRASQRKLISSSPLEATSVCKLPKGAESFTWVSENVIRIVKSDRNRRLLSSYELNIKSGKQSRLKMDRFPVVDEPNFNQQEKWHLRLSATLLGKSAKGTYIVADPEWGTWRSIGEWIAFYEFRNKEGKSLRKTSLIMPIKGNTELLAAEISPDGKRILWCFANYLPNSQKRTKVNITFWISQIMGANLHQIRRLETKDDHAPQNIQWFPDSKRISFSLDNKVWIAPSSLQTASEKEKRVPFSKSELLRKSVQLASGEGIFSEPSRLKIVATQNKNEVRFFHRDSEHEWKEVLFISVQSSGKESVWKVLSSREPSGKREDERDHLVSSAIQEFTRRNFKEEEMEIWIDKDKKGSNWTVGIIPLPMMPDHFTFYSVGKDGSVKRM